MLSLSHYGNFLELLDYVTENGDSYCYIFNNKQPPTLEKLSSLLEVTGYGLFSFGNKIPHLVDKIKPEVRSDDETSIYLFALAPTLGLPSENPLEEIKELRNFLSFVKEEAINNPLQEIMLSMFRYEAKNDIHIDFGVLAKDKHFADTLNAEIDKRINASPVLTTWLENQKIGIKNTHPELNNLYANFSIYETMTYQEKDKCVAEILKNRKEEEALYRKQKKIRYK